MLQQRPESVGHAREAIAVARRVGDSFAEVNARINIFTQLSTSGVPPDPDDVVSIVEAAAEAGVYDEAYRAIVNFIWSASGYVPIDRIELVVAEAQGRLADVPPPKSIGPYLQASIAMTILVPSARWIEADATLARLSTADVSVAMRLVFLTVAGGLALRRGELETAKQLLEELRPLALASGEPQRIVPMAGVTLPWLVVTGKLDALRSSTEEILATLDRWPPVLQTLPVVRALAAAGETQLLVRTIEAIRETDASANAHTTVLAGEGLLSLLEGRADEAVEQLEAAVERERELGHTYHASCLELDLARALEAAGQEAAAQKAQSRAAAVLEPLGCVNPF